MHNTIIQGMAELSVKLSVGKVGTKNAKVLILRGESTKGGTAIEQCNFRNKRRFSDQTLEI